MLVQEIKCPKCKAPEINPFTGLLFIRGFKICDENGDWWSQCLVCAGYYDDPYDMGSHDEKGNVIHPKSYNQKKGWFK